MIVIGSDERELRAAETCAKLFDIGPPNPCLSEIGAGTNRKHIVHSVENRDVVQYILLFLH